MCGLSFYSSFEGRCIDYMMNSWELVASEHLLLQLLLGCIDLNVELPQLLQQVSE